MWNITWIDDEYGRSVEMRSIEQITTIFLDDYSKLSQRRFNVYKLCNYESHQRSVHEQWYVRAALYILSYIILINVSKKQNEREREGEKIICVGAELIYAEEYSTFLQFTIIHQIP